MRHQDPDGASVGPPSLSVIVPVYNGGKEFRACLEAICTSDSSDIELIVVDDGSTDDSAETARGFGATILTTSGRRGPAHARNLGANHARGELLLFLDADVIAHPDTIGRVIAAFQADPQLDALVGSYDDSPAYPDFLSQYKNLMHHFVHQCAQKQASTFWTGCGAIRREVFLRHGGFDESYARPAIEDIELGYRLRQAGCRMVLDGRVQVKHLKRWTFIGLLQTDVLDRGIPWTELILRDRRMPNDLNLQTSQRASVVLVYLLLGMAAIATVVWKGYFLVPLGAMLYFFVGRYWSEGASGPSFVICGSALLVSALAWWYGMRGLIPPVLLASLQLLARLRHPAAGLCYAAFMAVTCLLSVIYLPKNPLVVAVFVTPLLVILLNTPFYRFLATQRGWWFAFTAVPFHLLFFFYCGISFGAGLMRFAWRTWVVRPQSARRDCAD
jgi:glycosyltransferase involved in cell wall biosynthesis